MKLFAVLSCLLSVSLYSGEISREIYKNINSHGVELITSNPKFPWNPDVLDTVPNFEFGPKYGDNYGARVRGYIAVPEDGDYTFTWLPMIMALYLYPWMVQKKINSRSVLYKAGLLFAITINMRVRNRPFSV